MLTIDVEEKGKILIFSIQGEILPATSREFDRAFEKYISNEYAVMAIDLKKIKYIDSYGLSRLVKLSRAFTKTGGEFLFVNMNENIRQIFRMATLDRMFTIKTGEEFASAYLDEVKNSAVLPGNSKSKIKTGANTAPSSTVQYMHNDVSGTTLIFEDEDIGKS